MNKLNENDPGYRDYSDIPLNEEVVNNMEFGSKSESPTWYTR